MENNMGETTGLALSGGGFRAMLFHLGALWRLNEMAMLAKLGAISSVSGGALLAGLLAVHWRRLRFKNDVAENFEEEIVEPTLSVCGKTIDVPSSLCGIFTGTRILEGFYERHLVGKATLQDLPDHPDFIFNAYHLESGRNWIFSKEKVHSWRIGDMERPTVPLAKVLAASSAFPPAFPPVRLKFKPGNFQRSEFADHFHRDELRETVTLGDGGVYDNLGVHAIRELSNILVSDGGSPMQVSTMPRWKFWTNRITRAIDTAVEQTRALRRSHLMKQLTDGEKKGTLWTVRTDPERYTAEKRFEVEGDWGDILGSIRTRLNAFSENEKSWLVNWGYLQADLAVRSYYRQEIPIPERLPFPDNDFSKKPQQSI